MNLFKNQFTALFQTMNEAGYTPTFPEFKTIVFSRAPVIKRSLIAGQTDTVIQSDGKPLLDFIKNIQIRNIDKSKKARNVHPNFEAKMIERTAKIPAKVKAAFDSLPGDISALQTVVDFDIEGTNFIERNK